MACYYHHVLFPDRFIILHSCFTATVSLKISTSALFHKAFYTMFVGCSLYILKLALQIQCVLYKFR